jgi:hypothetical protein
LHVYNRRDSELAPPEGVCVVCRCLFGQSIMPAAVFGILCWLLLQCSAAGLHTIFVYTPNRRCSSDARSIWVCSCHKTGLLSHHHVTNQAIASMPSRVVVCWVIIVALGYTSPVHQQQHQVAGCACCTDVCIGLLQLVLPALLLAWQVQRCASSISTAHGNSCLYLDCAATKTK